MCLGRRYCVFVSLSTILRLPYPPSPPPPNNDAFPFNAPSIDKGGRLANVGGRVRKKEGRQVHEHQCAPGFRRFQAVTQIDGPTQRAARVCPYKPWSIFDLIRFSKISLIFPSQGSPSSYFTSKKA